MASVLRYLKKGNSKEKKPLKISQPYKEKPLKRTFVVAAIDIGTTFSGTAFGFKNDLASDPPKILTTDWPSGKMVSMKTPTCVLIKNDGATLDSFGYAAERKFGELTREGKHTDWFYFRHFKMMLYENKDLTEGSLLEDFTGRKLSALKVFSLCIGYLKKDLQKNVESKVAGIIQEHDIRWVITVPAIWNETAKHFMRKAAETAGIDGDLLNIALEPEAASLYCRTLPVERCRGTDTQTKLKSGSTYLVLDAGGVPLNRFIWYHKLKNSQTGGTVDITVHKTMSGIGIREVYQASGGNWGGINVDLNFLEMLKTIFGAETMKIFKAKSMEDYNDLLLDFETKKREMSEHLTTQVTIRIPLDLVEAYNAVKSISITESLMLTSYREKVTFAGDKLRLHSDTMKSFFLPTINKIVDHVKALLKYEPVRECAMILLVGGFSDSSILQEKVRSAFPTMTVITPDDAGLAVLKGAVLYGNTPEAITERVCKYTYGTHITHTTSDKCSHKPCETFVDDSGILNCNNIFSVHVKRGQTVKVGEKLKEIIHVPVSDNQTFIDTVIYTSPDEHPSLITDEGCTAIGKFRLPITGGKKCRIGVTFMFGGSEIEVIMEEKRSGEVTTHRVEFVG